MSSSQSSWRESSGRAEGPAGRPPSVSSDSYRFGDLSRSVVKRLLGTDEPPEEELKLAAHVRETKRFGWKPDLPDHRDLFADLSHIFSALPARVDLRKECAPLYDQGELGSCTAHAIAAAFEFDQRKEKVASFAPSRLFLYYGERLIEGTTAQDSGAQLRDGIKVVHKLGVCDEELWPYEIDKFADEPPQAAYAQAKQHTATRYYRVPQHLLQLKGCLAAGFPFVLGFVVLTSFETPEVARSGLVPMPSEDDEQLGGHAVCCVGYDDANRCFIVRNSWGDQWGDGGYFYMPYDYMTNKGLASDFWTIRWVE